MIRISHVLSVSAQLLSYNFLQRILRNVCTVAFFCVQISNGVECKRMQRIVCWDFVNTYTSEIFIFLLLSLPLFIYLCWFQHFLVSSLTCPPHISPMALFFPAASVLTLFIVSITQIDTLNGIKNAVCCLFIQFQQHRFAMIRFYRSLIVYVVVQLLVVSVLELGIERICSMSYFMRMHECV